MMATQEQTALLTIAEAASVLRLQPSTLRSWVLKRRIQYVKLGGRVFLRKADCDAFVHDSIIPAITPEHDA